MQLPLTLLLYTHKPRTEATLYLSPAEARAALANTIRTTWYRLGPCDANIARTSTARCTVPRCPGVPAKPNALTDADAIAIYFGHLEPAETYTITTVTLDLGTEFSAALGILKITSDLATKATQPDVQAEYVRAMTAAADTVSLVLNAPRTAIEREAAQQP